MRKILLGKTEQEVSIISLGTWSYGGSNKVGEIPIGWEGQQEDDSINALKHCYQSGINHWDTADVYGDGKSERIIGSLWDTIPRNEIFLATKVGWDMGSYEYYYHPDHMRKQIEKSLINLQTECVDLLYLHHCNFGKNGEYFDDAIETIRRFQEEGKTRFLGLSDWDFYKIMIYIDKVNPDVVQPYRNVMDDHYLSSGLKNWIDKNNAGVCFFSPIKHGLLTGKYNEPVKFGDGDFRSRINDFNDDTIIKKMQKNKALLENRFSDHPHPVMRGIIDSLLFDSPSGCVLLGQRNINQVKIATTLGGVLSKEDVGWVKSLYNNA
ncbi:MAG: aldo/keto reductase [Candidatus Marinimicrobia bacterium]|nr:aldo/keto reductase [Candidatus Neomarinimicrobiota bacterium]